MRLTSGRIVTMSDEVSNGNAEIINNAPITATQTSANLIPHAEYNSGENITVIDANVDGSGQNPRLRITPVQNQPQITAGWPPFGFSPGCTPSMSSYTFPVRYENVPGTVSNQPSFSYPDVSDYQVGSSSNNSGLMVEFRQYIDESHHDLVNLLTHQMTTILNPILVDSESKYDQLLKQVERIVRIIDYDKGQSIPQDLVVDQENIRYNEENIFNNLEREENILYLVRRDQNAGAY
ncbi:hypothetical protein Ahy_A08g038074 [Arachis hypogaea]|uniref:Uncharacterized protein n=1 Tax=Arachis hypogaea TaxID=3818 RepID=A0A445BSS2_ARAHY|nr:hypothetical protein Ahy_A08g038074 [Arachis hypogaea]